MVAVPSNNTALTFVAFNQVPRIVGRVQLRGARTLHVALLGSRELHVSLKGGVTLASTGQNFEIYAGDTKNIDVTVTDVNSGTAVDLTGAVIKWKLDFSTGSINKDTSNGGVTLTSPSTGVFTVNLNPADTSSLQGSFSHGAELIDASGNVSTLLMGLVKINPAII